MLPIARGMTSPLHCTCKSLTSLIAQSQSLVAPAVREHSGCCHDRGEKQCHTGVLQQGPIPQHHQAESGAAVQDVLEKAQNLQQGEAAAAAPGPTKQVLSLLWNAKSYAHSLPQSCCCCQYAGQSLALNAV